MKINNIVNEALPAAVAMVVGILSRTLAPSMFRRGHLLIKKMHERIWRNQPVHVTKQQAKRLEDLSKQAERQQEYIEGKNFLGRIQAKADDMLSNGELRNLGKVIREQEKTFKEMESIIKSAKPNASKPNLYK